MTDIIEREGDRIYSNRLPPCGHNNGTHPSGCWYVAVCDAVAAERARIKAAVLTLPTLDLPTGEYVALENVLDEIIEGAGG